MMGVVRSLQMVVAGTLAMAMPLQAVGAAVRPSSAVPAADRAVAAEDTDVAVAGLAWPAISVIIAAIITAIVIERHNGHGRGTGFSR